MAFSIKHLYDEMLYAESGAVAAPDMNLPTLRYCPECGSDWSWRMTLRRCILACAIFLACLAFGQTTGEQAIRIADLERRVQPVDGLTVSVAELKSEVHAINEKVDTQTTQSREILFGFLLLFATKLMDAFGFTVRRGKRKDTDAD